MVTVAILSITIILYTYAGYPALVALWAKLAPEPTRGQDDYEPMVSVCFSVHNGAAYVGAKIRSIQELEYPEDKLQILVFADGCTDETANIVRELALADSRITLICAGERRGKPAALNRLRAEAVGDVLLMCDVRQPLAKGALRALLRTLSDPSVGCASGILVQLGNAGAGFYGRYEHFIRGSEARAGSMVGVTGCLYAIRKCDMPDVPPDVLLDDMFVPLCVALSGGKRIVLADGAVAYDDACDDAREFLRKVRTLAGNYQLIEKMPRLLVPGMNPLWFRLTSHKLLRLACPWAFAALFMSTGTLAFDMTGSRYFRLLFIAQIAFYLLAVLGSRAGRAGSLTRTFVVLNAAAVVGLWRFVRRSQAVTW